jgi:hypothetical protein
LVGAWKFGDDLGVPFGTGQEPDSAAAGFFDSGRR